MKRLRLLLMAAVLWCMIGFNVLAEGTGNKEFDFSRPDFQGVVGMLSMEGHATHDVSNCSVKKIYYDEIAEMMQKGMTKDEVIDYYVNNLGEQALQAPPQKGFNLTLWVTPFVLLLIAAIFIGFILKKWRKKSTIGTAQAMHIEDSETEKEIMASMIESERKKYL